MDDLAQEEKPERQPEAKDAKRNEDIGDAVTTAGKEPQ
jgi:hypothetical protein